MKRVLIITYYWPPSGGAGVQRWLKMVKYLPQFGWKPVVFTAKDAEYPIIDESLQKDVPPEAEIIRQPIWEPYDLYKKVIGQKKEEKVYSGFLSEKKKPGFAQRASVWIRGNLFIPDARCFWIGPSRKFLIDHLKKSGGCHHQHGTTAHHAHDCAGCEKEIEHLAYRQAGSVDRRLPRSLDAD